MTFPVEFGRISAFFLAFFLRFTFRGASCQLVVSPAGPTLVNALVGHNVTLAVSFTGAPDPVLIWSMGDVTVVTWAINSTAPPVIADDRRNVLRVEANGSLSFVNVQLGDTSNYTIEMTKPGLFKSSVTFTLKVFDVIQSVALNGPPGSVREGAAGFTLRYSMQRGVVEQQAWFFGGAEIQSNSHYSVQGSSLVIRQPNRSDAGRYAVLLKNPFSQVTADVNVTVLYGPDEPVLEARPARPFYLEGDSLSVSCTADGFPPPTAEWVFGAQTTVVAHPGVLDLPSVQTSQGGLYVCTLINAETGVKSQKNLTLNVYVRPANVSTCSVQSVSSVELQYSCQWPGGTPPARLSLPALNASRSGVGNLSLVVPASHNLDGKTVTCVADHPVELSNCSITAGGPRMFPPAVRTTVDPDGKMVVAIDCVSEASPPALVSWSKGSEDIVGTAPHQISRDTTELQIRDYNVSNFLLQNYTCTGRNPLGSQRREIQLRGPSISNSRLFFNHNGTIVTLTWEVPPTSIVTGFDVQMKGPNSLSRNLSGTQSRGSSDGFHTVQQKPGGARSADIFFLDPKLTYGFRVVPKARTTAGQPSAVLTAGPGEGLSGSAIAGLAAGIPCGLLLLVLLGGLIYFCVYLHRNKSRQTRYPKPRAVEKAVTAPAELAPHKLLTGGLRSPPDYNRLQQTRSERSVALPAFVPARPVRTATIV
ncbi:V-set and immunoglobulin domain-containing protein 10-like [Pungitius pungitius]|uniref:V-set and immunoglobulin domain-containing protein 10-like n=1 Tax=Pungitius pungitius TaxID=134920 RepID=UPI002E154CD4